jgi:hypothetical protein
MQACVLSNVDVPSGGRNECPRELKVSFEMPLILPQATSRAPRQPILADVRPFYGYEEITGHKASISGIIDQLSTVPRSDAVRWLCAISKALLREEGLAGQRQIGLARQIFCQEWVQALEAAMRADGEDAGSIFHRRSVWLVLQMAVLSCRDAPSAITPYDIATRVGHACFMANDIIVHIESEADAQLSREDTAEWMIAVLVPRMDCDYHRVDSELVGRAHLLWIEVASCPEFHQALRDQKVEGLDEVFREAHGVSLVEHLRFLVALYVRFFGNQLEHSLNPLLFDVATDEVARIFSSETTKRSLELISQGLDELAMRLFRTRQNWTYDVTPLRERPLLEIESGRYCCPDLNLLVRAMIDRVYFLLQDAYGKERFGALFGKLFQCYIDRLAHEFAVTAGPARTYLSAPHFVASNDEAGDGILYWSDTATVMEYKAGLLTTRQRFGGNPEDLLRGIDSLASRRSGKTKKGVAQLADNLKRLLENESPIVAGGHEFNTAGCTRVYPILTLFDESIALHAVRRYLQGKLDNELRAKDVAQDRLGPLMLLSVRDWEYLSTAGQSVSVESMLHHYADHLRTQPNDYTGTFSSVIGAKFGPAIDWKRSLIAQRHHDAIREISRRFESKA